MKKWWLILSLCLIGCSNLEDLRFSEGLFEEKRIQLVRKVNLIQNDRTKLVAFATYLNELEPRKYRDNEFFFVEVSFEDEKIKPSDLSFSLLGKSPSIVSQQCPNDREFQVHSKWNQGFLVVFPKIWQAQKPQVRLIMSVKGYSQPLIFDYTYEVQEFED